MGLAARYRHRRDPLKDLLLFFWVILVASLLMPFFSVSVSGTNVRIEDLAYFLIGGSFFVVSLARGKVRRTELTPIALILFIIVFGFLASIGASRVDIISEELVRAVGILFLAAGFGTLFWLPYEFYLAVLRVIVASGSVTLLAYIFQGVVLISSGYAIGAYSLKNQAGAISTLHINSIGALSFLVIMAGMLLWKKGDRKLPIFGITLGAILLLIFLIRREIAGFIAASGYLLLFSQSRRIRFNTITFSLLGLLVTVLALGGETIKEAFYIDFSSGEGLAGRGELFAYGVQFIVGQPLGFGFGGQEFIIRDILGISSGNFHNTYLAYLIEVGVFGFVLFLVFLWHVWRGLKDPILKALFVWLLVASFFGPGLYFYKIQWFALLMLYYVPRRIAR